MLFMEEVIKLNTADRYNKMSSGLETLHPLV